VSAAITGAAFVENERPIARIPRFSALDGARGGA
jgi:hypothetical protein